MANVLNGYHKVYGLNVYVENGIVKFVLLGTSRYYPYKWDSRLNAYNKQECMTLSSFRSSYKHRTLYLF